MGGEVRSLGRGADGARETRQAGGQEEEEWGTGRRTNAATEGWLSPRIGPDRIGVGEDGEKIHERIQPLRRLAFETGSLGESGIEKGKKERANERE